MIDTTKTLRETFDELHIPSSYTWKPERFHAKYSGEYINVDVVSDGSTREITDAVTEASTNALYHISDLKEEKIEALHENEDDYMNIMDSVRAGYQQMQSYFERIHMPPLETVMATALANLNLI